MCRVGSLGLIINGRLVVIIYSPVCCLLGFARSNESIIAIVLLNVPIVGYVLCIIWCIRIAKLEVLDSCLIVVVKCYLFVYWESILINSVCFLFFATK